MASVDIAYKKWPEPRSYLPDEARQEPGFSPLSEAIAALGAGDMESCEGWMRQIEFCASAKRMMTQWADADYWAERGISV